MWAKPNTNTGFLLSTRSGSTAQGYELISRATDGFPGAGPRIGTSATSFASSTVTDAMIGWLGKWTYVTATVDVVALLLKFYVNGVLLDTIAFTGTITNTQTLRFGQRATTFYTGSLNDCRIYNRALSDGEVLQLYRASCTGYQRELNWIENNPWSLYTAGGAAPATQNNLMLLGVS